MTSKNTFILWWPRLKLRQNSKRKEDNTHINFNSWHVNHSLESNKIFQYLPSKIINAQNDTITF